ncbi:DNA modification methylase [Naasia sp. SYSU D00057]|uniref:DNA modification methylase n=1 Tax=Naasia sp. SYSU D00057 TaxID=2817380 RepID=UPI001B309A5E|nr:DNA modification methylase [Naasia sp. SYSU D00057]
MLKVRSAVSALLAAVLAVAIAGCSFTNGSIILPRKYDPSDGVGADIGKLDVRNALLISEEGDRGNLVVSVINPTEDEQPLTVQYESATAGRSTVDLTIPANSTVTYGWGDSDQIVFEDIDTIPGALFPVYFQSGDSEGADLQVPVLDTTLAEYNNLTPSPSPTPTPTPTAEPVPAPTPTEGTIDEGDNSGEGQPGDSVDTAE